VNYICAAAGGFSLVREHSDHIAHYWAMAGLVLAIHAFSLNACRKGMDARDEAGTTPESNSISSERAQAPVPRQMVERERLLRSLGVDRPVWLQYRPISALPQ